MNRRAFLRRFGYAAAVPFLPASGAGPVDIRPNVLFIAVDDLRPTLRCYGDHTALTPYIDRLAAHGTLFDRAYCQQAVCNPSRASLMTGRRPDTIKVWDLSTHFRKTSGDIVTLPQHFKQHGYHSQCVGKIYHGKKSLQDPPSWSVPEKYNVAVKREQYVLAENRPGQKSGKMAACECADVADDAYWDGKIADEAIKALEDNRNKPFFLAVGFMKPHLPFSCPKKYWDLYNRDRISPPANPEKPADAPELALHDWVELRGYTDIPNKGPLSPEKIAELRHGYYACVSYTDAQVGKLLDALDRLRLARNTVIVLWGDHGWHLGEHALWCKTTNFELDTRAPLIVAAPEQKRAGTRTSALVEFVDIYPTLVELCGLPTPEGLEGISMVPLLEQPDRVWKKAAFSQFPRPWSYKKQPSVMGYTIRTRQHRYTEWLDFDTRRVLARELYAHAEDSQETVNLADKHEHAQDVRRMSKMLHAGWQGTLPPANKERGARK
jgi:iduronate 2-sulfatase